MRLRRLSFRTMPTFYPTVIAFCSMLKNTDDRPLQAIKLNFKLPIRVYYEDTDAGGVVYHSNYINFFERARTEWLRSLGIEQDTLLKEHHLAFVVRALECDYLKPALFNDELFVSVDIRDLGKSSVVFTQQISKQAEPSNADNQTLLSTGTVTIVAVDTRTFKPTRLPRFLVEKMKENTQ